MALSTSPRLPGVTILRLNATGPEYSRWRRAVKFALETKGTWKYCSGKCPMPMPEAGPIKSRDASPQNLQPSLLDERRAWVREDREVKLDLFLSLAEEVMQGVFEVGPPLPPSSLNAKEMLDALDEHFSEFKFEAYHHAFCHFLNLHIDQYTTIEDFNNEFSSTLEDLLDYGQPLSNTQACSAYFSKLRCTQNPWVAKQLAEWDSQSSEPELFDLMRESPSWSFVRPLATKSSRDFHVDAIPEESLEDSSAHSDSDAASEHSNTSTMSSRTTHSRNTSSASQEITIHASKEDITEIDPLVFRREQDQLPASAIPERRSSKDRVPTILQPETVPALHPAVSDWLSTKKNNPRMALPAPLDRPLPPLPPQAAHIINAALRSRSKSPHTLATGSKNSSQTSLTAPTSSVLPPTTISAAQLPMLKLETTHPTLRPRTPTAPPPLEDHPAFRVNAQTSQSATEPAPIDVASAKRAPIDIHLMLRPSTSPAPETQALPSPPRLPSLHAPSPSLAVPWPSTPDVAQQPPLRATTAPSTPVQEALATQHQHQQPQVPSPPPQQELPRTPQPVSTPQPLSTPQPDITTQHGDVSPLLRPRLHRSRSASSSVISLPLQGTRDSAWDYLYEAHHPPPPREHSVSPIDSTLTALPSIKSKSALSFDDLSTHTALHPAAHSHSHSLSQSSAQDKEREKVKNREKERLSSTTSGSIKSSSLDFVTRMSGDSVLEKSEEEKREQGIKSHRKKKSWHVGVNLARFSASKGVKEII